MLAPFDSRLFSRAVRIVRGQAQLLTHERRICTGLGICLREVGDGQTVTVDDLQMPADERLTVSLPWAPLGEIRLAGAALPAIVAVLILLVSIFRSWRTAVGMAFRLSAFPLVVGGILATHELWGHQCDGKSPPTRYDWSGFHLLWPDAFSLLGGWAILANPVTGVELWQAWRILRRLRERP